MTYKLVITSIAQQEITDAFEYYLSISQSVAEKFLAILDSSYNKLEEHPHHYSYFGTSKIIRSIAFVKFPYCIVFRIIEDTVIVIGLHNTHQITDNILKRI